MDPCGTPNKISSQGLYEKFTLVLWAWEEILFGAWYEVAEVARYVYCSKKLFGLDAMKLNFW